MLDALVDRSYTKLLRFVFNMYDVNADNKITVGDALTAYRLIHEKDSVLSRDLMLILRALHKKQEEREQREKQETRSPDFTFGQSREVRFSSHKNKPAEPLTRGEAGAVYKNFALGRKMTIDHGNRPNMLPIIQ